MLWMLWKQIPNRMQSYTAGCLVSAAGDRVLVEVISANVLEPAYTFIWASAGMFVV